MSLTFPNRKYVSGNHSMPTPCAVPVFSAPFEGVPENYVLNQDWQCDINFFTALELNTPHPDFADYLLVREAEKRDVTGGMVRWTRTYAKKPATFAELSGSFAYNFIGFDGNFFYVGLSGDPVAITGRARFTRTVPLQTTRDFFLIGDTDAGADYATDAEIPPVSETRYYFAADPTLPADYLFDDIPISGGTGTFVGTRPTRTDYQAMIDADEFNVVVEPSAISRWMGNIYIRETRRIKAL